MNAGFATSERREFQIVGGAATQNERIRRRISVRYMHFGRRSWRAGT